MKAPDGSPPRLRLGQDHLMPIIYRLNWFYFKKIHDRFYGCESKKWCFQKRTKYADLKKGRKKYKFWGGFQNSANNMQERYCFTDSLISKTYLLFWNQILTCCSFKAKSWAIWTRRARVRYLLKWNSFSSSVSCRVEKVVRPDPFAGFGWKP